MIDAASIAMASFAEAIFSSSSTVISSIHIGGSCLGAAHSLAERRTNHPRSSVSVCDAGIGIGIGRGNGDITTLLKLLHYFRRSGGGGVRRIELYQGPF